MKYGEAILKIIQSIEPDFPIKNTPHFRARTAGRFIEEAVELALACGAKGNDILGHVADALHNESKKADLFPSELGGNDTQRVEVVVEVSDCGILLDLLCTLFQLKVEEVMSQTHCKLALLHDAAQSGDMVLIDGLMYRKESRT